MSTPRLSFRLSAALYLLLSLGCTQIPLLQTLGYEFAALLAIFASLVSGLTAARFLSLHATGEERPQAILLFRKVFAAHLVLLFIPFAVMAGNAVFIRNCSFPDGLFFFLLLPVVSVWFSVCLAAFCALHYRHPRLIFLGAVLLSLAYALAIGYLTPAIFSYNLFYGYFPGLTYDEALRPDRTLLLFRIFTVALGALLLVPVRILAQTTKHTDSTVTKGVTLLRAFAAPPLRWGSAIVLILLALVFVYRGELGFESPAGFVQQRLGAVYETPHFLIYYASGSFTDAELRRLGAEHEFRLHQIMQEFRMPSSGRFTSYVYPSADVKQRLMGAGGTNIARPWSGEVHIHRQAIAATLKHELVHIVAAPFGVPVIRASLRPGLVEGLAMAIEWDWGNRTLHQYAAAMRRSGLGTDIRGVMEYAGFASRGSSVSYVLAGSFCRYLIDTYGIRTMTQLYRTGNCEAASGYPLDTLVAGWERLLDSLPVSAADRDGIQALFLRPPMFRKVCARVTGARNLEAGKLFGERRFKEAAELYGRAYREAGSQESLTGFIASALPAGDLHALLAIRDTVVLRDTLPARYLPQFVQFGLAAWATGDTAGAMDMFTRVEQSDVLEDRTEIALLCRSALTEPDNRAALLRYYCAGEPDSARLRALDGMVGDTSSHWLPLYLKAKVLIRMQRPEEAARILEHLDLRGVDSRLEAFRLALLGGCLYDQERFAEAGVVFRTSQGLRADEVWRLKMQEWADRCTWEIAEAGR